MNIGPDGTFKPSGAVQTRPRDVDEILNRIRDHEPAKLAVHFHGGLVKEARGLELAERILPTYEKAGAYGVTVVWETGLLETIVTRLDTINRTKLFNKLVNYAIRHAAKWLGASVGAKGPGQPMAMFEVEQARRTDAEMEQMDARARGGAEVLEASDVDAAAPELELEIQADLEADPEIDALLQTEAPQTKMLDQRVLAEVDAAGAKGIGTTIVAARIVVRIVVRTLKRFTDKRDHGVIPTVVEEVLREAYLADLGEWVWSGMKTASADMWKPNDGPIDESTHAGSYLLAGLADLQAQRAALTVDVVGHSAGSIAIANLLETAAERHPGFKVRKVVLLAPAASADVFVRGIIGQQDRFESFRMFTMADELECKDRLVPGVYPRSLLYFISGVLDGGADTPVVGLRRHTDGKPPYTEPPLPDIHDFLKQPENRLVLSRTKDGAAAGLATWSTRHGDFDDDARTLASLTAIIAS